MSRSIIAPALLMYKNLMYKNNNGTQFHNRLPQCDFFNIADLHKQTSVILNH